LDEHELAWAAGFFDGDGWAAYVPQAGRRTRQPRAQINQASPDGMPEVLERFRAAVRVGTNGGPKLLPGRLPMYRWTASSKSDVDELFSALWPYLSAVKRRQLAAAVRIGDVGDRPPSLGSHERAWAAGFFDAEGNVSLRAHRTHTGYFIAEASVTQTSSDVHSAELERFKAAVGPLGKIYGPFGAESDARVYRWKVYREDEIAVVLHCLAPWLGTVKRDQFDRALRILAEQALLPRGNPAWGIRKTHCKNGHEYTEARLRPYRSRGGGVMRRPSKQCLVCARDQARANRAARQK